MKIFSSIRKYLHFPFHLYSSCIYMPTLVSEFFPNKSSILSIIICNPQFFIHSLDENLQVFTQISPLPFPIILQWYLCAYPCISVFVLQNICNIINYLMLCSILPYICQMKMFSFIRKQLYFFFQLHSNCICKPIIVSVKITTKIFKFCSLPMYFHLFIRYMFCKLHEIYQKNLQYLFQLYYHFISMTTILCVIITTKYFKVNIFT